MDGIRHELIRNDPQKTGQVEDVLLHLDIICVNQHHVSVYFELEIAIALQSIVVEALQDIHTSSLDLAEKDVKQVVNDVGGGLTVSDEL